MSERVRIDERLREAKGQLEQVSARLEALSKALWESIDHDDPAALEAGVRFKQGYNERRAALEQALARMLALLAEHPAAGGPKGGERPSEKPVEKPAAEPPPPAASRPAVTASPLAKELEQKLPFGFMLGGQTFTSASAWPLFYEALLQELYGRAPERLSRLADAPDELEIGGRPLFARVPDRLDDPLPIAEALFAEADLAPAVLLEVIKRLVREMGYPLDSFKILLKEKNRGTVETLSIAA
ncbi:MAG: hypothetical protein MUC77_15005 [Chromatiaceae bacterium]|jgi:hypothetical protein|nr:hypothetical protein [Chromatiaceae bacterium]